jgi:hypothetical protein
MDLCKQCGFEVGGVLCEHLPIRTGTGSGPTVEGDGMPMYRWARCRQWSIKFWPNGGGAQGFVDVPGMGTVVDVDDEMPHEVWVALLGAVDGLQCL